MQLPVPIQISPALPEEHGPTQPRLLLVDDNTINLRVLSLYARKCSTIPSTLVGGGQAAIDAFNATVDNLSPPYDLVFLDLSMPEVSGFDVARSIRRTEARLNRRQVYICAITGLTSTKDRTEAYACGVNEYLVKPVGLKDLLAVVGRWRERMEFGV
jgi:CheY-like chemotaxis protein